MKSKRTSLHWLPPTRRTSNPTTTSTNPVFCPTPTMVVTLETGSLSAALQQFHSLPESFVSHKRMAVTNAIVDINTFIFVEWARRSKQARKGVGYHFAAERCSCSTLSSSQRKYSLRFEGSGSSYPCNQNRNQSTFPC